MPRPVTDPQTGVVYNDVPDYVSDEQAISVFREMSKQTNQATPIPKEGWDFSAMRMLRNVPKSGMDALKSIWSAVTDIPGVVQGTANVARGLVEKLTPGVQEHELYADLVFNLMKDRYGGWDEIKRTLETDPVGFMQDLSGSMGVIGKLPKLGAIGKASQVLDPLNIAASAAVKVPVAAGEKVAQKLGLQGAAEIPERLYQAAGKFSTTLDEFEPGLRRRMAQTAMKERILPTPKGLDKLNDKIAGLGNQLQAAIDKADAGNRRVPVDDLKQPLLDARLEIERNFSPDNISEIKAIDRRLEQLDAQITAKGRDSLSVNEAQKYKRQAYDLINWGKAKITAAKDRALRLEARGAMKGVEGAVPEAKDINQQLARLLELREPSGKPGLARAAARVSNRNLLNPFALGPAAAAGFADVMAGGSGISGAMLGGLLANATQSPALQAALATSLYHARENPFSSVLASPYFGQSVISPMLYGTEYSGELQQALTGQ